MSTASLVGLCLIGAWMLTIPFAARHAHCAQERADRKLWGRGRDDWEWSGDAGLCVLAAFVWPVMFLIMYGSGMWESRAPERKLKRESAERDAAARQFGAVIGRQPRAARSARGRGAS